MAGGLHIAHSRVFKARNGPHVANPTVAGIGADVDHSFQVLLGSMKTQVFVRDDIASTLSQHGVVQAHRACSRTDKEAEVLAISAPAPLPTTVPRGLAALRARAAMEIHANRALAQL